MGLLISGVLLMVRVHQLESRRGILFLVNRQFVPNKHCHYFLIDGYVQFMTCWLYPSQDGS